MNKVGIPLKRVNMKVEDWTVVYCDTIDECEQCISDKLFIWPILQNTVRRLLSEDRESLPSIEIRNCEGVSSIWVTVRRSEIMGTLGKLMKWREEREEYEECAEVRDMISLAIEMDVVRKKSQEIAVSSDAVHINKDK